MGGYQGFYNGVPMTFQKEDGSDVSPPGGPTIVSQTRPSDWLSMPVPNDNEIYMLVLVPDGASTLMGFTVTCSGSYLVELGTVENGRFVYIDGRETRNSGDDYTSELFADKHTAITSDGMKQIMIKISGDDIRSWNIAPHPDRSNYGIYPIVDIRCRLPKGQKFGVSTTVDTNHTCYQLKYFSWEGPNELTDASYMFTTCYGLEMVYELDTSKVTDASYMFRQCFSLISIPSELDLSSAETTEGMFYNCYSLKNYPKELSTGKVKNMSQMFRQNVAMIVAPILDYSSATNLDHLFYTCMSLKYIPRMNITKATSMTDTFTTANSISKILFDPDVVGWDGLDINMYSKFMGHNALVDLINSLPKVNKRRVLTITRNYGLSSLTEAEKAVAEAKNWTVNTTTSS